MSESRGKIDQSILETFFEAGYDQGHLVDVILQVGEKTMTNYLYTITQIPIDFPAVPKIG